MNGYNLVSHNYAALEFHLNSLHTILCEIILCGLDLNFEFYHDHNKGSEVFMVFAKNHTECCIHLGLKNKPNN